MNHTIRLNFTKLFPSAAKTIFFGKYKKAMESGVLPNGWKESEIFLIPEILDSESVFFDVGANVGIYSYLASKYILPENIHAFEPMPNYFESLKKLFSKSHVRNIALSNTSGVFDLKIPAIKGKKFTARATLNTQFKEDDEDANASMIIPVKTQTLDAYCLENSLNRLDLIKIDVEGHESSVLEGGKNTIMRFKPTLIVEIEQRHHQDNIAGTINYVCDLGYKCCYHDLDTHNLVELDSDVDKYQNMDEFGTVKYINNFIFTPV